MTENPDKTKCHIYGIKNCDAMKKTFKWCDEHGIAYAFHDYKKQGVPRERLVAWCRALGWKTLLNTKGSTWRKLSPEQQDITTLSKAVATMMEHASVIRRPMIETPEGQLLVGFDPTLFESFVR
jgi:arsenate reductase